MTDKAIDRLYQEIAHLSEDARENLWRRLVRGGISPLYMTPSLALAQARESGGSDFLREVASQSPRESYEYARYVDKEPHVVTRKGASKHSRVAYNYAFQIDKGTPHPVTRKGVLPDPISTYLYARNIDKCPREDTRNAASKSADGAYKYALEVDEKPHDVTRKGVIAGLQGGQLRDAQRVARYALHLDRVARRDTWEALQGTHYEARYLESLGVPFSMPEGFHMTVNGTLVPNRDGDPA